MKRILTIGLLLLALFASAALADKPSGDAYVIAVGDYYGVTKGEVLELAKQVSTEELPVICFVAERSGLEISEVVARHKSSDNLNQLASKCDLTAADFFVWGVSGVESDTYSPVIEKFKTKASKSWSEIELSDSEIVDLANLRFMQGFFGSSGQQIMVARDGSGNWSEIYSVIRKAADQQSTTALAKSDK